MNKGVVRIQKIELNNFKNVGKGSVEFKQNPKNIEEYVPSAEVLGIYGQNGSGKTAMVNACRFLKRCMDGIPLPEDSYNYINLFEKEATLKFDLYIQRKEEKYLVNYQFTMQKQEDNTVKLIKEKLSYYKKEEQWSSKKTIIDYDINLENEIFRPKNICKHIMQADKDNEVNLKVAKKLVQEKNTSFIFNENVKKILYKSLRTKEYIHVIKIIDILTYFARCNLFVIMNEYSGVINSNILLPFSFRLKSNEGITAGDVVIGLDRISIVDSEEYDLLKQIVNQMNIVLKYIVPELQLELLNYGNRYNEKGNEGIAVELLSLKGDKKLPIRYESEGIKKIISILSAMISMYNNPSVCMVVDELDSGIYEYLLGEILSVIETGGKGQLIFTSHNLRPLEVLNKDSIYFTTTNKQNRYIRFANVKESNNLRSMYIRSIMLGGQSEILYNETDKLEIRRAFKMAGDK